MQVKMPNEYKNFKYFIECYFNWSMDYIELEKLIIDYINRERKEYIKGLQEEVNELYNSKDPVFIKKLIYKFGRRNLSVKKVNAMIELLCNKLNNK